MKKNYFLLFLLMICQGGLSLFAQESVVVPEAGVKYTLLQGNTGFSLTRVVDADNPQIKAVTLDLDQVFVFEPVDGEDGTYYIKSLFNDEYLVLLDAGTGNDLWSLIWVTDPTDVTNPTDAEFQIVTIPGNTDYIEIMNLSGTTGQNLLGTDGTTDGSTVYGNKGSNNVHNNPDLYSWKIKEYSTVVDKSALQIILDQATALFDSTSSGSGSDQYPSLTRDKLEEYILNAEDIMDDENASQGEVNAILLGLTSALQDYINSVNPFQPDVTATYYIIHTSGFYFSASYIDITDPDYSSDQQYQFVAVPGQTAVYNIMQLSSGEYLTRQDNGWDLALGTDPTVDLAQFQIKSTGTGYYTITCLGLTGGKDAFSSSWGTDNLTVNSGVYTDKSGTDARHHYWTIVDIKVIGVVKTALQAAVDKVTAFLAYAEVGDGSDQYPATEYDALTSTKTAAEGVLADTNATQEQVSDATLALNNALAACIAAVNPFQPDPTVIYSIIHYGSGLYLGEYSDDSDPNNVIENGIALLSKTGDADQHFIFAPVADTTSVYTIKILSLNEYLTRSDEAHLDPSTGEQQIGGDGSLMYDDYKLIWGDDPDTKYAQFEMKNAGVKGYYTVKCRTAGPQRAGSYMGTDNDTEFSGVYIDKDGTNILHYWKIVDSSISDNIKTVATDNTGAFAYGKDQQLTISNLTGSNKVSIYTITGQLITTSETGGSSYSKSLPAGTYIVVVNGNSSYRGIVIVQ